MKLKPRSKKPLATSAIRRRRRRRRTPLPTPTASGPVTQTATPLPTPLPTATPISKESAMKSYQDYLTAVGVTDAEYRKYVEMNLFSDKMRQAIGIDRADDHRADQVQVHPHRTLHCRAYSHGSDQHRTASRRCTMPSCRILCPTAPASSRRRLATGCRMDAISDDDRVGPGSRDGVVFHAGQPDDEHHFEHRQHGQLHRPD